MVWIFAIKIFSCTQLYDFRGDVYVNVYIACVIQRSLSVLSCIELVHLYKDEAVSLLDIHICE